MERRRISDTKLARLWRELDRRIYQPTVSLDPGLLMDLAEELLELRDLRLRHEIARAVDVEADAAAMAVDLDRDETPTRPLLRVVLDPAVRERDSTRRVRSRSDWMRAAEQDAADREP